MKKNVFALVALAALTLTACKKENTASETNVNESTVATADAVAYNVNATESTINWVGSKMAGDSHTGTITLKDGVIYTSDNAVTGGKFTVDMNTITVTDLTDPEMKANLEGHLKGLTADNADHFFNTTQFPTALFEITNVSEENNKHFVEGNLTLKGATHSIKFPATINVNETEVTMVSDEFEIDRTKFGVNYNSGTVIKDLAADNIISDNIKLNISVKANK